MTRGRGKLTPQEEALKPIISGNIKKYLDMQGKKAVDLQKATGISQSSISEYINAKTLPIAGNTQKIADYFGVFKSDIDPRFADDFNKSDKKEQIKFSPDLEDSIENAENYSGKPLSNTDKQILRGVIEAYLANRDK